jgi:glutathione S-transferase
MLELYHYWDSFCSFKVRLCLEEKGLEWKSHYLDLMRFENLRPQYLELNPNGVVPTLVHDGRSLIESSIINEYLDDRFPAVALRPKDAFELAQMRLWVKHEEEQLFIAVRPASLNLMMKQVLGRYTEEELDRHLATHPRPRQVAQLKQLFKAPFDPAAVESSRKMLGAAFKKMDASLAKQPWLAGSSYSLADIACAPVLDRVEALGMSALWEKLPAMRDWVHRLTSRPAYNRAKPRDEFRLPKALPIPSEVK